MGLLRSLKKLRGRRLTIMAVPDAHGKIRKYRVPFTALAVAIVFVFLFVSSITYMTVTYGQWLERAVRYQHLLQQARGENAQLQELVATQKQELARLVQETATLQAQVSDLEAVTEKIGKALELKLSGLQGKQNGVPSVEIDPPKQLPSQGGPAERDTPAEQVRAQLWVVKEILPDSKERLLQLENALDEYQTRKVHVPSIWPITGHVTSEFGLRRHPIKGTLLPHHGIDIAARSGTPVRVTANGTVTYSGWKNGYGWVVEVDHGYGVETIYAHNRRNAVEEGSRVQRGDVIAYVGSTGMSTGPHVHYEVRLNGKPVDPRRYLPRE